MTTERPDAAPAPDGPGADASVSAVIARRRSTRAFLPDPIDPDLILDLLRRAARAPSGGNLQPWHATLVTGARLDRLKDDAATVARGSQAPEYAIYPSDLVDPYRTRRYAGGEALYAAIDVAREDRDGRLRWLARNFEFFGAPAAVFLHTPRLMGPPQWADLGMFLQSFLLLLVEAGLDACPQEAWATLPETVRRHVPIGADDMLFCGVAIGRADPLHPINALRTERADASEWIVHVDD
ncbi:nitroreductase [Sphingomonas sp.]|uniref:nitroreductase n=1 Tax=Sphingomonas sp. TaxID=28214 RepID=UPI002DD6715A|nr:nitroreductase [Sphingomonas sp.]